MLNAPCASLIAVNTWHVKVYTSDLRGAGTDANVWLVAYGKVYGKSKDVDYRKTDEITLDNKGDNFESGQMDAFKVEMDEIGKPYKIRIGHDNTGNFAGWHLDKVLFASPFYADIKLCNMKEMLSMLLYS